MEKAHSAELLKEEEENSIVSWDVPLPREGKSSSRNMTRNHEDDLIVEPGGVMTPSSVFVQKCIPEWVVIKCPAGKRVRALK